MSSDSVGSTLPTVISFAGEISAAVTLRGFLFVCLFFQAFAVGQRLFLLYSYLQTLPCFQCQDKFDGRFCPKCQFLC